MLDQLLLPQRLAVTLLDAVPRLVAALERIDAKLGEVERRLERIDDVPGHIEGLQDAFDRSNDEIEALRHALKPEVEALADELGDVRDTVAPVGRIASKLPGSGPRKTP